MMGVNTPAVEAIRERWKTRYGARSYPGTPREAQMMSDIGFLLTRLRQIDEGTFGKIRVVEEMTIEA